MIAAKTRSISCASLTCWSRGYSRINRSRVGECLLWGGGFECWLSPTAARPYGLARSRRSVRWTLLFALTPSRGFESRTLLKGAQSYLVDLLRKKWRRCSRRGGCPNFELRSKFTRSAASADRAPLKTRHRRVFLTLRALSGSNPPPSASTWRQGASLGNYSIIRNSMKNEWRREGDSNPRSAHHAQRFSRPPH